ncbi:MAG: PE-PPE domain-containing protein, partial [Mycobacterium sp.]
PGVAPVDPSTPAADPLTPTAQTALIMGPTGQPIPSADYLSDVSQRYLPADVSPQPVFIPAGSNPLTGVQSLPFDVSVAEGVSNLNQAVLQQVARGDHVTVFGDGQSATIASLAMQQLANGTAGPGGTASTPVSPDQLSFVLAGDPDAPNGGLLERFYGLDSTSLGIPFYGATPSDTPYATDIYTIEYDGFSDFPRYPLNLLADLNAVAGMAYLHDTYPTADVADAIPLGASDSTQYFLIPQDELPLLDPLRSIPVLGNPLADLLQPDLKVLVNLGYGADDVGYSTPADVATPIGLFPDVNPVTVLTELVTGAEQGFHDAVSDIMPGTSADSLVSSPASLSTSLTDIGTALQNVVQVAYNTLFPTADTINTLLTSVPAYDLELIQDNLANPLDAIGLPIAADMGLITLAGGLEYEVLANAATQIGSDLSGLIP